MFHVIFILHPMFKSSHSHLTGSQRGMITEQSNGSGTVAFFQAHVTNTLYEMQGLKTQGCQLDENAIALN